ncbi:MAG: sigma-54-dependent Fis family transcriptional regulator [Kiritimatiellae bacterium]|nr:sigma-54-dependent Fis family transcriptional regulator [Kiritimatiellia bacterium]
MKPKILIVDDEKMLRDTLSKWFRPSYDCLSAPDAAEAMRLVESNPDLALMISDVKMPGEDGVALLRKAKAANPGMAVILLTAYGTVDLAVEAMKDGADDFFQKPITDLRAFEARVARAMHTASLEREVKDLRSRIGGELERFTGKSPAMENVYRLIRKVAPTDATVLIEGPSGSGKELAAQAIHSLSRRADGPFVALECSAFQGELLKSELFGYEPGTFTGGLREGKRGCIESAAGGTLFLDEIGEIDTATQITLLRTLETKSVRRLGGTAEQPVDFRLVCATNKDLAKMVAEGTFREDLYYRLNVIDIRMPALKDHRDDIAPLVARFMEEFSAGGGRHVAGIEPAALKALEDYSWPGNVRQLRNVVEKMVILANGERLTADDLPVEITAPRAPAQPAAPETESHAPAAPAPADTPPAELSLHEAEKRQILAALAAAKYNKTKAAAALGISRRTLHRKLREWNGES